MKERGNRKIISKRNEDRERTVINEGREGRRREGRRKEEGGREEKEKEKRRK